MSHTMVDRWGITRKVVTVDEMIEMVKEPPLTAEEQAFRELLQKPKELHDFTREALQRWADSPRGKIAIARWETEKGHAWPGWKRLQKRRAA